MEWTTKIRIASLNLFVTIRGLSLGPRNYMSRSQLGLFQWINFLVGEVENSVTYNDDVKNECFFPFATHICTTNTYTFIL